jgi:hypothetical protein
MATEQEKQQTRNIFGFKHFETTDLFEQWQRDGGELKYLSITPVVNTLNTTQTTLNELDNKPNYGIMIVYVVAEEPVNPHH